MSDRTKPKAIKPWALLHSHRRFSPNAGMSETREPCHLTLCPVRDEQDRACAAGSIWPRDSRNLANPASRKRFSNLRAATAAGPSASRGSPVSTSAVNLSFPGTPTASATGAWHSSRQGRAIRPPLPRRRPLQKPLRRGRSSTSATHVRGANVRHLSRPLRGFLRRPDQLALFSPLNLTSCA
jgi:hypothetical protein